MLITGGIIETGLELINCYMPVYAKSLGLGASQIGMVMGCYAAGRSRTSFFIEVVMAKVVSLYRYPVKGFTPERREQLRVWPGGRVAGDRVLNFRFADAPVADSAWCRKYHGVVLANTPGLALLDVVFDEASKRLRISHQGMALVDDDLSEAGRQRLVDAITGYVLSLDENPLKGQPMRLPLKLVGDGATPRYQDNEGGQVTLHSSASIASAGVALGDAELDEARFRHNIVIEGVAAWDELTWVGRKLRVGAVTFETVVPKVRCLATHANPRTGERDLKVMQTLVQAFKQREPTLGIGMLSREGGDIAKGDEVTVLD